jgi:hypothetical protein
MEVDRPADARPGAAFTIRAGAGGGRSDGGADGTVSYCEAR